MPERRVLSMGVVPQFEAREMFEIWQPLLARISQKSGLQIELTGSPGIQEFERGLREGWFDFAYLNPYHMLIAADAQGYQPMVRDGDRHLQGILVVRRDSSINSVSKLSGKTLVFPAPNALGASLLLRSHLHHGLGLPFNSRYVGSHNSVYLNVALGLNPAGGGVVHTFEAQPPAVRRQLRVLMRTEPVSPHPVAVHPRVSSLARERFKSALLDTMNEPDMARVLARIPISRIVTARMEDYQPLRAMRLEELTE